MSSKTRKPLRKKGKKGKTKKYNGGSNRSVKSKVNMKRISLYLKEIDPDDFLKELKIGDYYYFNVYSNRRRYLYNGKYIGTIDGNPTFTDTYNVDEESVIERNKSLKYSEDVAAKNKIYKFAIHPRSKLPQDVIMKIASMSKVNHTPLER